MPDLSEKDAHGLAMLDPKILEQVVKQKMQAPQEEAFASALSGLLGNGQQVQQPQQQMTEQLPAHKVPENVVGEYSQWQPTPEDINQLPAFLKSEQGSKMFTSEQQQEILKEIAPHLQQQQPKEATQAKPRLNAKNALELAKLGISLNKEEKQAVQKEKAAAQKETAPYYREILEQDRVAKKMDADTNRMLKLIEKGDLPNPAFYKILKNLEDHVTPLAGASAGAAIGGALGALGGPVAGPAAIAGGTIGAGVGSIVQPITTLLRYGEKKLYPDTEEFEKLSAGFIAGAKAIFGSRITDRDLISFMETVPTLGQTDSGKKAVIRNIQLTNKAAEIKAKNMRKIIAENGGSRPADLQNEVEERSSEELDKLAKQFVG